MFNVDDSTLAQQQYCNTNSQAYYGNSVVAWLFSTFSAIYQPALLLVLYVRYFFFAISRVYYLGGFCMISKRIEIVFLARGYRYFCQLGE